MPKEAFFKTSSIDVAACALKGVKRTFPKRYTLEKLRLLHLYICREVIL